VPDKLTCPLVSVTYFIVLLELELLSVPFMSRMSMHSPIVDLFSFFKHEYLAKSFSIFVVTIG
jgi:hypothetical protein